MLQLHVHVCNKSFYDTPLFSDDSSYGGNGIIYRDRSGVIYTHWGSNKCTGNLTDTLYSGTVVSSRYSEGGTNSYLCLIPRPKFYEVKSGHQAERTKLYGTEFGNKAYSPDENFSTKDDVSCAVCDSYKKKNILMVPGTYECPLYWTTEYTGYLMAGYYSGSYRRKETICVDKNPRFVPGTSATINGANLFFVESTCTGIKCAPYELGAELTCAVCSK